MNAQFLIEASNSLTSFENLETSEAVAFDLTIFNEKRITDAKRGMYVLGTWAVGKESLESDRAIQ